MRLFILNDFVSTYNRRILDSGVLYDDVTIKEAAAHLNSSIAYLKSMLMSSFPNDTGSVAWPTLTANNWIVILTSTLSHKLNYRLQNGLPDLVTLKIVS